MKEQYPTSPIERIKSCLIQAKPELQLLKEIDVDKHIHFDFGLDSLDYQRLTVLLEDEFQISIEESEARSGFFASVNGIQTFLTEYKEIK